MKIKKTLDIPLDEVQRIVAESCGWTCLKKDYHGRWLGVPPGEKGNDLVLNFHDNLDAMHDAEERLPKMLFSTYLSNLMLLCDYHFGMMNLYFAVHACAEIRARAFIMTIAEIHGKEVWNQT